MARQSEGLRYWIAVVPKSRVEIAFAGNFAMFAHGRDSAVVRVGLHRRRTDSRSRAQVEVAAGQLGWRRAIAYDMGAHDGDVHPLLEERSFIKDGTHWGLVFHRSVFSVPRDDFARIAAAMG
jgi:hypothetical protein